MNHQEVLPIAQIGMIEMTIVLIIAQIRASTGEEAHRMVAVMVTNFYLCRLSHTSHP